MLIYTVISVSLVCHSSLAQQTQGYVPDANINTRKQKLGAPKNVVNTFLTEPSISERSSSQDYISSNLYAGSPKYTKTKLTKIVKKFFDPGQGNLDQVSYNHGVLGDTIVHQSPNSISGGQEIPQNGEGNNSFKEFKQNEQKWLRKKQNMKKQYFITSYQNNNPYKNSNTESGNIDMATWGNKPVSKSNQIRKYSMSQSEKNSLYKGDDVVSNKLSGNDQQQLTKHKLGGFFAGNFGHNRNNQFSGNGARQNRIIGIPHGRSLVISGQNRNGQFPGNSAGQNHVTHGRSHITSVQNRNGQFSKNGAGQNRITGTSHGRTLVTSRQNRNGQFPGNSADQNRNTAVSSGKSHVVSGQNKNGQSQRKGISQNGKTPRTNVRSNSIQNRKRKFPFTQFEAHRKTELEKMMNRYNRIKQTKRRHRKNRMRNNNQRHNNNLDKPDLTRLYWLLNSFED